MIDPALLQWATPSQAKLIEALNSGRKTTRQVANEFGISRGTLSNALRRVRQKAARHGYSPEHDLTHPVPDGFKLHGASILYDRNGKPTMTWVKSRIDEERQAQLLEARYAAMAAELPRVEPVSLSEGKTLANLCNVYTITDFHMGMLAWHREGGADWDLKIAERTLDGCFQQMVMGAPRAATCVIAQLGDFQHVDGLLPVTPTSGHIQDTDGRFTKIVEATIRSLRRLIDFALTRHDKVVVLMAEGNHDMASAVWLQVMFKALYENEPRVEVIDSALPYYAYQHGKTMLGWHHGHLSKNDSLPLKFATEFRAMWGEASYVYLHTGHRHHREVKEHSGAIVEQHPTLASRDAYAARGGWHANREAVAITYDTEFGEVGRNTVRPEMLAAA